ncbi:MAG: hypothetical protein IH987_20445 [Planctomycetes bacterium]|nr:hypothetical protein [Planctomycetota bacterium]
MDARSEAESHLRNAILTATSLNAPEAKITLLKDRLTELARDGVDVFRLNMAHGDRRQHESMLERIRRVAVRLRRALRAKRACPQMSTRLVEGLSLPKAAPPHDPHRPYCEP